MPQVQRVQIRAAAMLWDQDCLLLQAPVDHPVRWAVPGGHVETGETTVTCLKREFIEEMDLRIDPQKLLYVHEHFYCDEGISTQEYGFYWSCTSPHPSSELRDRTARPVETHMLFRWVPRNEMDQWTILPEFLSKALLETSLELRFLSSQTT